VNILKIQKIERTKTGIPGFDELVQNGLVSDDLILLSGPSGAGKTIFSMQFLFSNAEKEHGIYVSFEEDISQLKKTARSFGWDVDDMQKKGQIKFLKYDPYQLEDIIEVIESSIREIDAKRVVIDSISAIGVYVKDLTELRRMILQTSNMLRKNHCTSLLVSEIVTGSNTISRFGVEEFVTDGVVVLHNILISGEYRRGLGVWKMRATDHSRKIHPYRINKKGFIIFPGDTISYSPGLKKVT
jgi:KaiC/GvpD/RAD55 family RecA-like ATPase